MRERFKPGASGFNKRFQDDAQHTFVSQREPAQLRMLLERFHADDVIGGEPDDGDLVLLHETRPGLRLLASLLVNLKKLARKC